MKHQKLPVLIALLVTAVLAIPANASQAQTPKDEKVVWRIGEFDQTSREFGHNLLLEREPSAPIFIVGQSKAQDWPASQGTWREGSVDKNPTPYTIVFDLQGPPHGVYHLRIAALLVNPSVPDLMVEINGHRGRYFFERKISYYPGDDRIDSPIYGGDTLDMQIPAEFLRAGENRLILTAVPDSQNPDTRASLIYDALELSQSSHPGPEIGAVVNPTVFYRQRGDQLYELTAVTLTSKRPLKSGEVQLSIGGHVLHMPLKTDTDFGQERLEFEVPEFSAQTPAIVSILANGKHYRFRTLLNPERKWSIFLVPHLHLDIGYTDYQAKVAELQSRNIDKLLDFMPQNPEMRFSLDGSWVLQNYFSSRNAEMKKKLLDYVREGKISVPAQYANLLTGYASLEELIRSLSYSHGLHRIEGVPFDYANITDVPSVTWSYPSVLKAAGINYFAEATNSDRGPVVLYGKWNEKSPFWREGPGGARVLVANTRQYSQLWFVCDLPPEVGNCRQGLPAFLQQFSAPDYKPDTVLMFGSQLENTDARLSEPQFVSQWSAAYAYPRFILGTFPDYFHYIEQNYGSELSVVKGDGGPYWEDGVGADANNTALDRNNQSGAIAAEELSTVSRYLNPSLEVPRNVLDHIWTNLLLYAEHTWDSWNSVYQPDTQEAVEQLTTKDEYAHQSGQAIDELQREALSQIAHQVHMPASSLLVFNTLSWPRSGLVELDLGIDQVLTEYPDQASVPFETLSEGRGYRHVRFMAQNVPSMGFKCYSLETRPGSSETESSEHKMADTTANLVENQYYRVEADPETGAVKSIFDKQLNRELVDSKSPYRFDQYLYVEGGSDDTQIVHMRKSLPYADLKITPASDGRIVGVRTTPFGKILTLEAKGVHTPSIRTEILLYDDEKKIEFVNHLTKESVRARESGYFAFPVAAQKPSFQYEIQNGWVDPARDMLKGAGLEWFSVAHWVKTSAPDGQVAITPVDAPLITLGDVNRGLWPEEFKPRSSTIFSYAFNNYWHTNYRAEQGGELTFRYAMTSGSTLSPGDLARFGRSAMTPLEADQVIDQDKVGNPPSPLEPIATSFLQLEGFSVVVENWKAAEDGNGSVLRLLETSGTESKAVLRFPLLRLQKAWWCTAMEDDLKEIPVGDSSLEVTLQPHQIATIRILARERDPKPPGVPGS
ncbi:MAG TPA: polysaccharide lyase family protein [Candidatus Sulfotelmatobacter sp.]|nr:polysaccharide lyase family protein [Candidatus Sulfotelmatobacter sp.]